MSRTVIGELDDEPQVVIDRLHDMAGKHNVEFAGDSCSGYAKGKGFHIEYCVEGKTWTLKVVKKPMLVPWTVVEHTLHKIFKGEAG